MSQKNNDYKKKLSLSELLNNKKFCLIISVVVAFVLWGWVAIEKSPETQRVITDVPVQIILENSVPEQLGLDVFGNSEFTVDVTVKGKKYVTSSLTADDIVVTANTNYVDSSGVKNLQLKVSQKDNNSDYEITSYSTNYIEVYFDTYKEAEVPVVTDIDTSLASIVRDDCIVGDAVLSKNTVLISGPAAEVNKIVQVVAEVTVDRVLEKSTTFDPVFRLDTTDGTSLEYVKMETDNNEITVTVPVLKEVTLPTVVEFRNAPSYFINNPLSYTVYPSTVKVAVPVDMVSKVTDFSVATIDFADISSSVNSFSFDVNQVKSSWKITDENITKFTVRIDASSMASRTISVPASSISVKNNRDDFDVAITHDKDISVRLVGDADYIDNITADDLTIQVDTTEQEIINGTAYLSGDVIVSGDYPCWAVGQYDIKVSVKEK